MPEIFLNYRTDDADHLAAALDHELSHRFGRQVAFRDSKSLRASQNFPHELIRSVRRSSALLALIGPGWAASPKLRDPADWVRREIEEALAQGVPVVPVLDGRNTAPLRHGQLPTSLRRLADLSALTYAPRTSESDLARICEELALLVPDLAAPEPAAPAAPGTTVHNLVSGGSHGTVFQTGPVGGGISQTTLTATGPLHTGTGDQHTISPTLGDNSSFVLGNQYGGSQVEGNQYGGAHLEGDRHTHHNAPHRTVPHRATDGTHVDGRRLDTRDKDDQR